jgi:hypothetical protein
MEGEGGRCPSGRPALWFPYGTSIKPTEQIKAKVGSDEEDVPNPAFVVWKAQEQQVLSYLLSSVSRDILVQITALPTAAAV